MSEANDIGPTSPDVGSNALKAGREADGLKRIGEAAPAKAGPAEGGSELPSCASCIHDAVWLFDFPCRQCTTPGLRSHYERKSASGPAFPSHHAEPRPGGDSVDGVVGISRK